MNTTYGEQIRNSSNGAANVAVTGGDGNITQTVVKTLGKWDWEKGNVFSLKERV